MSADTELWFTPYRPFVAEGARVALVSCHICGAAVFLDPDESVAMDMVHRQWHESRNEAAP